MSKTLKNSTTVSVSFNDEISGVMNGVATLDSRELKLAVAIYQAPELFNVRSILTAEKKGEAINKALANNSTAFADKVSAIETKTKALKGEKNVSAAVQLRLEIDQIKRTMAGAVSMFNRACQAALFLKSRNAVIVKVDSRSVKVNYVPAFVANADKAPKTEDLLTRKEMVEGGVSILKADGAIKSREAKGNGSKPVSLKAKLAAVNTVSENMKVLSDTVTGLTGAAKDEFIGDKNTCQLLATLMHKQFAHAGTIDMADVVAFIRSNVSNVKLETATVAAPARKAS